jgi:hypothetical protein
MFEKLEREHKERLDKQQKQYEEHMHSLEEKMKQRLDQYLSTTNRLNEFYLKLVFIMIYLVYKNQNQKHLMNQYIYVILRVLHQLIQMVKDIKLIHLIIYIDH